MSSQAEEYCKNTTIQKEDGLNLIKLLCPHKGSMVLDLGCGTGYLAYKLAECIGPGGKVVGVDPDIERLKVAKENYGTLSNVVFLEGRTDVFPEDQYDVVFSNYVLHWVKDKEVAFRDIHKNLKSGGSFGLQVGLGLLKSLYF